MTDEDYIHTVSTDEMERIQRFVVWAVTTTLALAALGVIFIISADYWLKYISFQAEKRFFDPYTNFVLEHVVSSGDLETERYLQGMADGISSVMDLPQDFRIAVHYLEQDDINAVATMGGHIFVFSGLLEVMPNENALAMIIAHEVAHIKNRDPLISASRGVVAAILLSQITGNSGSSESFSNLSGELALNAYSREQESTADLDALQALQLRYGHIAGAVEAFETMAAEIDVTGKDELELMSTHPVFQTRINQLKNRIKEEGWRSGAATPIPDNIATTIRNNRKKSE